MIHPTSRVALVNVGQSIITAMLSDERDDEPV